MRIVCVGCSFTEHWTGNWGEKGPITSPPWTEPWPIGYSWPANLAKLYPQHEIYNIGTSEKVKISFLANLISKICKEKIKIVKSNLLKGSPSKRCPDINKIKKLGFKQKISLRRGLEKIILND